MTNNYNAGQKRSRSPSPEIRNNNLPPVIRRRNSAEMHQAIQNLYSYPPDQQFMLRASIPPLPEINPNSEEISDLEAFASATGGNNDSVFKSDGFFEASDNDSVETIDDTSNLTAGLNNSGRAKKIRKPAQSELVPDTENPGKFVTQKTLKQREYYRKLVDDPDNKGKKIKRSTLNSRKYDQELVDDPDNPGHKIKRGALKQRKYRQEFVDDPDNKGKKITRGALYQRKYR